MKEEEFSNLKETIDILLSNKEAVKRRDEIKNLAWRYQGQAAVRTVDYLVSKYNRLANEEDIH